MQPIIHHRVRSTANYESNSCPKSCQLGPFLLSNHGWVTNLYKSDLRYNKRKLGFKERILVIQARALNQ